MRETPFWADALLTLWVAAVAAFYFGGYFVPAVGAWTQAGAGLYALMLLGAAGTLALRFARRAETEPEDDPKKGARTKNRK